MKDSRSAFLRELKKINAAVEAAFRGSYNDMLSSTQRTLIEAAIRRGAESGNWSLAAEEVITTIRLGPRYFAPLDRAVEEAFLAGGVYQSRLTPKSLPYLQIRLDHRAPRAENWIRQNTGHLIKRLEDQTRQVVLETVQEGLVEARSYRNITRDLLGSANGEGAVLPLHPRQAGAVRRARAELRDLDTSYFSRSRRNRNFDGRVRKAIRTGKPLSESDIREISGAYANRLRKLRAETVARTEGNRAMQAGRVEAVQQSIDSGQISAQHVTKIWDATLSKRTRDSHQALNGTSAEWDEVFVSPITRERIKYPHDVDAHPKETINCRCTLRVRVDYAAMAR